MLNYLPQRGNSLNLLVLIQFNGLVAFVTSAKQNELMILLPMCNCLVECDPSYLLRKCNCNCNWAFMKVPIDDPEELLKHVSVIKLNGPQRHSKTGEENHWWPVDLCNSCGRQLLPEGQHSFQIEQWNQKALGDWVESQGSGETEVNKVLYEGATEIRQLNIKVKISNW